MINVYIETSVHAEWVATIQDEWTYMELLPAFEKLALEWGGIVTESVFEDTKTQGREADSSPNTKADLLDTELNEMILAVGNAQYQLEIMYNSDADDRDEIERNLEQLSKVELLLRNLKS